MSMAPGSSGLGKRTVGNAGSGSSCSSTGSTRVKPASASTRASTRPPTPCRDVVTTRSAARSVGPVDVPARSARSCTDATYASTTSRPKTRHPDSTRGTPDGGPAAAMASAMRASWGGTICAPCPASVTTRPPRYTL